MAYDATDFTAPVRMLDRDPKSLTEPRERLEYLRDFLRELPPERFDMAIVEEHRECGTVACIAGWRDHLFGDCDVFPPTANHAELFMPRGWCDRSFAPTPTQAANVLDHLLRTGDVDWSVA